MAEISSIFHCKKWTLCLLCIARIILCIVFTALELQSTTSTSSYYWIDKLTIDHGNTVRFVCLIWLNFCWCRFFALHIGNNSYFIDSIHYCNHIDTFDWYNQCLFGKLFTFNNIWFNYIFDHIYRCWSIIIF